MLKNIKKKNIKAGEALHAGDGGYGVGTKENYNEFVKVRNESLNLEQKERKPLTIKQLIQKLHTTMVDARGQESHFESWLTQNEGICVAIDMLKELAKQEQGEPVAYDVRCDNCGGDGYDPKDNNYYCSECEGSRFVEKIFYTTPYVPTGRQQRTWIGLTDEDKQAFLNQDFGGSRLDAMDYAEKLLKDKNHANTK